MLFSAHWLHDYSLHDIHHLTPDFKFLAVPSPQTEDPVFCVAHLIRGHSGVALGWRSSLDHLVSPLPVVSSSRMVGIEYKAPCRSLFIISVYLPSRSGCTDDFKETLDQLDATMTVLPPGADIIIMAL